MYPTVAVHSAPRLSPLYAILGTYELQVEVVPAVNRCMRRAMRTCSPGPGARPQPTTRPQGRHEPGRGPLLHTLRQHLEAWMKYAARTGQLGLTRLPQAESSRTPGTGMPCASRSGCSLFRTHSCDRPDAEPQPARRYLRALGCVPHTAQKGELRRLPGYRTR